MTGHPEPRNNVRLINTGKEKVILRAGNKIIRGEEMLTAYGWKWTHMEGEEQNTEARREKHGRNETEGEVGERRIRQCLTNEGEERDTSEVCEVTPTTNGGVGNKRKDRGVEEDEETSEKISKEMEEERMGTDKGDDEMIEEEQEWDRDKSDEEWEIEEEMREWEDNERRQSRVERDEEGEVYAATCGHEDMYDVRNEMNGNPVNREAPEMEERESIWDKEEVMMTEIIKRDRWIRNQRAKGTQNKKGTWEKETAGRKRKREEDVEEELDGDNGTKTQGWGDDDEYKEEMDGIDKMAHVRKKGRYVITARWTAPAMLQLAEFFGCLKTIRGLTG
jgi:hypothetical protein